MTPRDERQADWILVAFMAAVIGLLAWAHETDPPVPDQQSVHLDTAYSEPVPAPQGSTYLDSLVLCRARATQTPVEIPLARPYEEVFNACDKAVSEYGPWRSLVR